MDAKERDRYMAKYQKKLSAMTPEEFAAEGIALGEEMLKRGTVYLSYEASGKERIDRVRMKAALSQFNRQHSVDLAMDDVDFQPIAPEQKVKGKRK